MCQHWKGKQRLKWGYTNFHKRLSTCFLIQYDQIESRDVVSKLELIIEKKMKKRNLRLT